MREEDLGTTNHSSTEYYHVITALRVISDAAADWELICLAISRREMIVRCDD